MPPQYTQPPLLPSRPCHQIQPMAPSTSTQSPRQAPLTCAFSKAPGSSVILLNTSYSSSMKLRQRNGWGITIGIVHFVHSCPHSDGSYLLTLTSMAPVSTLMCSPHPLSLSCTCMHLSSSLCPQESPSVSGSWSIPFPFHHFTLSLSVIVKEHHWIASSRGTTSAFFADTKKGNLGQNSSDQKCSYGKKKGHKMSECCKLVMIHPIFLIYPTPPWTHHRSHRST